MEINLSCIKEEMALFQEAFEKVLQTRVPMADSVIRYFLDRRGKQLRPALTLITSKLVSGKVTHKGICGAVAVELLHNASLMHDDVVDNCGERRGADTINKVWDNRVAVLTGDFFLSKCMLTSNSVGSMQINNVLGGIVTALAEGELEQLSNASTLHLSEETYFSVIRGKTASLFSACLEIGALSADATPEQVATLAEVGEKIGLIYQIRDDIFDYFPETAEIGKPTGHDMMEGKVTLPLLYALMNAPEEESSRMKAILQSEQGIGKEQAATLSAFAIRHGGIEYAKTKMSSMAEEAKLKLDLFPDNEYKAVLCQIIDYFVRREY